MKLAELPHSGAQSVFLIVLLNKKGAPVAAAVAAASAHADDTSGKAGVVAPVLLVFVQRYRAI